MTDNKSKKKTKDNKNNELEESKQKITELLSTIQHLQAEFENYRKRVERERESFCKNANQELIQKLITIADDFDLSMNKINKENHEDFVKAIKLVHEKFWYVLKNEGLEAIDAVGKPFNPELHEPLLQEESDEEPNTVLEILQPGYMFNNKVLRHARVKIAKPKSEKKQN